MKSLLYFFLFLPWVMGLLPPKFQWNIIDFAWEGKERDRAIASKDYIPENNMPTGIARWREKLFITIPRWKEGVPSSLNYVLLNESSNSPLLHPYPSWYDGYVTSKTTNISHSNATVVSTFRIHVDQCDRLWVVDNGVTDMTGMNEVLQVTPPAIVVFDLNVNTVELRYELPYKVLRDTSILASIAVDIVGTDCHNAFAYITDMMGSNGIIVYSMAANDSWRVDHPYFTFAPNAEVYNVGGVDFYLNDGISSAALSNTKKDGYRDLYLHPTSSTKQFRITTKALRDKNMPPEDIIDAVEMVGDRGPKTQSTACAFDPINNVLFYTQICQNGVACWNLDKPLSYENTPLIVSNCSELEFPNDIKVDDEGNLWMLSDRQSRFLYDKMDYSQINFRIMTAPVHTMIQGTTCQKGRSRFSWINLFRLIWEKKSTLSFTIM